MIDLQIINENGEERLRIDVDCFSYLGNEIKLGIIGGYSRTLKLSSKDRILKNGVDISSAKQKEYRIKKNKRDELRMKNITERRLALQKLEKIEKSHEKTCITE